MQPRTYLDNASTTFPKPPCVAEAVFAYMTQMGTNVGRGEYASALDAEDMVYDVRCALCDLFGGPDASDVVLTRNVTEALNLVLKGLLRPGDHVVVTSMEHNAVMRPLTQLAALGVSLTGHDARLTARSTPPSWRGSSGQTPAPSS